jgi:hypothetical protein
MTTRQWEELEGVLRELVRLQEALLEAAERKRAAIIANDVEAVEAVLGEETALLTEVERAEARRQALVADAARAAGPSGAAPKLKDLAAAAPAPWNERLAEAREALLRAVTELGRRTERNAALLQAALAHIDGFFRLIAEAGGGPGGYDRKGRRATAAASLINRRA